jgi:hypothetical protein
MILDSKHFYWVKPNTNEQKHVMGFDTHIAQVFGISKVIKSQVLGQVMDLISPTLLT